MGTLSGEKITYLKKYSYNYIFVGGGNRDDKGFPYVSQYYPRVGHEMTEEDIDNYSTNIWNTPNLKKKLDILEGKTLLCSCPDNGPCHADRLLSLLRMKKDGVYQDFLFR